MKSLIEQGISKGHIRLEDNNKYIVYVNQDKRRNFKKTKPNPKYKK